MLPTITSRSGRTGFVVLRRDFLTAGYDDRAIARLVRDGVLVRIRHGAFVDAASWRHLDEPGRHRLRARAVVAQARAPLALSHVSAVIEHGVPTWGLDLADVHTTRLDGERGRRAPGVRQHVGTVRAGDVQVLDGLVVTSPARAALETVTVAAPDVGLCVLNHVLHHRLATEADLAGQLVAMQTWPGMRPAEVLLRLADGRIESVGESRTFWAIYQQRLPAPVPQHPVVDGAGRVVARLDFAWPRYGVWLEFDGRVKYEELLRPGERASDVVVREKQREELVARLTGWRCVRITWRDLDDPHRLGALLRSFLFPAAA